EWIDREGDASPISAEVLVVLQMRTYTPQPPAGGGAARAVDSIGEGNAWIFADGRMVEGTWSRPDADSPFELETTDGDEMTVPAGRVWVSFSPTTETPDWS